MSISTLKDEVGAALRAFAWNQWSQMGVLARSERRDPWAIDPEALLLFTLDIARSDPRLFDEVLDWLLLNERLVSVQRLRNFVRDDEDTALVNAALAWVARSRPRARLAGKRGRDRADPGAAEPLFRATRTPVRKPDEDFLAQGLLKPRVAPSGNSRPPDPALPANFAFRLRHLLGVGTRAEVARILLGTDTPRMSALAVTESAGYAKRNVHEALVSLRAAGVVEGVVVGNEQRFSALRERWAALLGLDSSRLPQHREWRPLLTGLRRIDRWLADSRTEGLSDYMRASGARELLDEVGPELRIAGVSAVNGAATGDEYWDVFVTTVHEALAALG